ncbi:MULTISPECIES: rhomboid family intramembrane serine protease [Micromonospora]|uniref:rhomboid family intramembrane serine protease n=1 Tax=Micromonospora TaxID=1873 RepID=UPI001154F3C6|nr:MULTISPECIES: rhomboid family intramembrane serine protease [unclassified Micromonospora]WTE85652.1 rhomboid family intramembrane serine protease [Micromonospora zamorensis]MBQ0977437.1 rhomboid family intramembrane serine protease [Micromonospora sp. M61]MBQ1035914.1 rhomboid family intramembrane serine protease [Micromonospora sp. C81]TQJ25757.1 membrane associated rhomboid family serine protease [Micromonospora sp. A202]WTI20447.1 rhomboid family intramembrane serine protease [Micromonos
MSESPPTTPVCYRHPGRETYVRCSRCDRPICPDCMRDASVGHQCPECVNEGRRSVRPARTAFGGGTAGRHGYVTKTLIAVNALLLLLSIASARGGDAAMGGSGFGGLMGGSTPLTEWGAVLGRAYLSDYTLGGIAEGQWYRLVTAMFLHYGVLHLLLNMWALWVLGRSLEANLGRVRFAALYLIAGLGGNVAAYLFSSPRAATVGASTAVFGLFAALIIIERKLGRDISRIIPILVINLVFTLAVPGISIPGHLGGLVVGALMALVLAYAPRGRRTLVQVAGAAIILVVLLALVLFRTAQLLG